VRHLNRWLVLLVAVLAMAFAPVPKPRSRTDLEKLQGSWEQAHFSPDGGLWAKGAGVDTYKGDRLSCVRKGQLLCRWKVALDPSRRPKAIDLKGDNGELLPCAYKLDGDELTLAHPTEPGRNGRPAKLTPHKGAVVTVFKRAKPKKP
jgi:uncharacterized protein (TIGR03067 family)